MNKIESGTYGPFKGEGYAYDFVENLDKMKATWEDGKRLFDPLTDYYKYKDETYYTYYEKANIVRMHRKEDYGEKRSTILKGDNKPTMKTTVQKLKEKLKPYENYVMAMAALLLLDYLIFDGKYTDKIRGLVADVCDRLICYLKKTHNTLLPKEEDSNEQK